MTRSTITAVAADAGVSVTTVSHALSGKRAVSETTRARILRSVERLSYQPNVVASSLRRSTTQTVALLIPDLTNPYYPAVARAVQDVLERDGYFTFIGNTDGERSSEIRWLRAMLARSVDGVIMQPLTLSGGEIRDLVGDDVALVVAREDDGEAAVDRVWTDDARGITEAVRHLVDRGVTAIGFLSGPSDVGPGPARLAGWRRAVQDAGLEPPDAWVLEAPYTRDGGLHAGQQLLALPSRPRAVMCANDLMAIGVMDAARAAGLRIPADLAVVGFDDIETADLVSPRLTTIHNPAAELGAACAGALLGRLADGPGAAPARVVLPTRLVVRESA